MKLRKRWLGLWYLLPWGLLQLTYLTRFPLIHSDESWLGGLSRNMIATGSIACTEPFFDLKPRYPHAVKTLFHLLQQGAIECGGYAPLALRLLSLAAACGCLAVFYAVALRLTKKTSAAFWTMALMSADIQFLYASHFARSEAFLLLFLAVCLWALTEEHISVCTGLICAAAVGIAVFFHPNSFFLACACGAALLFRCLRERSGLRPLWAFCGVTAGFAAVAVGMSLWMDPEFFPHYLAYGQGEFDLLVSPGEKLTGLFGFFGRLWGRQSGTYYLPDIRAQLVLYPLGVLLCLIFAWSMRREEPVRTTKIGMLFCFGTGLMAGIALIGRLNQTSVVFLLPVGVLLLAEACEILSERYVVFLACCAVAAAVISFVQILPFLSMPTYESYEAQIAEFVPADGKTIANLNTGFYFDNDALLDYRNLPYALERGSLADYVEKNGVRYILYSDELDYIYAHRPYYNVIYGNTEFVRELRQFCNKSCDHVGTFHNSSYGTRINALVGDDGYGTVTVYRVREN